MRMKRNELDNIQPRRFAADLLSKPLFRGVQRFDRSEADLGVDVISEIGMEGAFDDGPRVH